MAGLNPIQAIINSNKISYGTIYLNEEFSKKNYAHMVKPDANFP